MAGKVVGFPTRATYGTRSSKRKPMKVTALKVKLMRAKSAKSKR